jgi:hypothetical protein
MYPIRIPQPTVHGVLAHSALPDAPVVPEGSRRRPLRAGRLALASGLHAAARAVEPAPRRRPEVCA